MKWLIFAIIVIAVGIAVNAKNPGKTLGVFFKYVLYIAVGTCLGYAAGSLIDQGLVGAIVGTLISAVITIIVKTKK